MKKYFLIFLLMFAQTVSAKDRLTHELIALDSGAGSALFMRSAAGSVFWPLDMRFISQNHATFCSIASSVMILNALAVTAPHAPVFGHYRFFTQDNFFTPAVAAILPVDRVTKQGATLDEISRALATFGVTAEAIHADTVSIGTFRRLAIQALRRRNTYLIVNYLRTTLKQTGTGHMSPIGAYDEYSDRFLIMDVSRYRYPPVWVKTAHLWHAMHTIDIQSHAFRGFVIVTKK